MIPFMIVFGLLLGRWWKSALALGAVGWAAVLFTTGVITAADIPGAALFGLANTGLGVAVHQGVLWMVRRLRGPHLASQEQPPTAMG